MRWSILLPAALFLIALAPRATFLAELRDHSPTFEQPEGGDSIFYDRIAGGEPRPPRAYFHSPLYQWFLGGVYRVFGRNLTAARLLQHLLGALAAVLVYFTALEWTGRRWLSGLAGLFQGLCGPVLFYEGQLLVDAILPVLLAATAWAVLVQLRRPTGRGALVVGLAIGVCALARANVLLWAPILLGWLALRGAGRDRWRQPLLLGLGLALVIGPTTVRNYVVERDLVLISSNGGLNLYIGNNPAARGHYNLPPGLWFEPGDPGDDFMGIEAAQAALGGQPRSSEVSRWWSGRALAFVADEPLSVVRLTATKALLLVQDYEQPQLYNVGVYRELCPTLRVLPTAGFVVAPALVGLGIALFRARRKEHRLFAALALTYGLSFLPFFVVGRYRAAWLVLLAPFAAWTVVTLVDALRQRELARAAAVAGATAVAALLAFVTPVDRASPAPQYYLFGNAALAAEEPGEAVDWYRQAVAADPDNALAQENLGIALAQQGQHGDALQALLRARELWPESARVHNNLGLVQRRLGQDRDAQRSFREAIRLDPALTEAYVNLGDLLESQGEPEEAAWAYDWALRLATGQEAWIEPVRARLGRLQSEAGSGTTAAPR